MRQAQKLPAYLHPSNEEPPKAVDGKAFIKAGMAFIDPADGAAYYSNGFGYFEGCINMRVVREHPAHTLLPIKAEGSELGYGDLERLLNDAKALASEFGRKAEAELDMTWLLEGLRKHGVDYERQKVPGSSDKHPFFITAKILGYTKSADEAMRTEIDGWMQKKRADKEFEKQRKKEDRAFFDTFEERQMQEAQEKQNKEQLMGAYGALYSKAQAAGLSNEKFNGLASQAIGKQDVSSITAEAIQLLEQFINNEIEVMALQQAATEEKPAPAELDEEAAAQDAEAIVEDIIEHSIEGISEDIAAESEDAEVVAEALPEPPKQEEEASADVPTDGAPTSAQDTSVTTGTDKPRETYPDEDGCIRYKDTGEYAEISETLTAALLSDAPVDEEKKKFTIDNEGAARWYTRKVRSNQKKIAAAEQDLKEATNARDAIKSRAESDMAGLKFVLGQEMLGFVKGLLTDNKGNLRKQSHHFMEGTVKLQETGGLVCEDEEAFKAWWKDMMHPKNESERSMYEHNETVSYTMNKTQILSNIENGLPVAGYRKRDVVENDDFTITAPPKPRKKKEKASAVEEAAEDSDESDEDAA